MEKNKRVVYYDLLSILASFFVVAMHCNWIVHRFDGSIAWKQSLFVDVLGYWAVPVFFMISGATLLEYQKKYNTRIFLKKRFEKTVLPFIIWSIIACIYMIYNGGIDIASFNVIKFFDMLLTTKFMGIYWFFIPLFMSYLSIPVLSYLAMTEKKYLWYMGGLGFISYSIYPFLCNLFQIGKNNLLFFPLTSGYVLFVILGYLLSVTDFSKKMRVTIYIVGIGSALIQYIGTYYLSMKTGSENMLFREYLNWPSVLFSISVFVWFKYGAFNRIKEQKVLKVIEEISSTGFGIYLIHIYIINFLCERYEINGYSVVWRVGGPVLVYLISFVLIKCMQRIPIVRKIVP